MNIGILGYGRMGHEVENLAVKAGHRIRAKFDIDSSFDLNSDLNGAEILISFTLKDAVLNNLKTAAKLGIPVVEGTTGWYDQLDSIKKIENLTMIYSPNFSIGMYQFTKLTEYAAQLYGAIGSYDAYLHEWHHTGKADSPSGTAQKLADLMIGKMPQKERALYTISDGKIDPKALHVTSTRVGRVPGTHEIGFDSDFDLIQLRHQAHGREGLAFGALQAAEWLIGKSGIFSMDDFMESFSNQ